MAIIMRSVKLCNTLACTVRSIWPISLILWPKSRAVVTVILSVCESYTLGRISSTSEGCVPTRCPCPVPNAVVWGKSLWSFPGIDWNVIVRIEHHEQLRPKTHTWITQNWTYVAWFKLGHGTNDVKGSFVFWDPLCGQSVYKKSHNSTRTQRLGLVLKRCICGIKI